MQVVRLTNLGNMALGNLLELDSKYRENADLKREKLSKLYGSREVMDRFVDLFSTYHADVSDFLVKHDDGYDIISTSDQEETPASAVTAYLIEKLKDMQLVTFVDDDRPVDEIASDIRSDEYKNPAKHIKHAIVELTGLCNCECKHCYRGGSREGEYGLPADKVKQALEPLLRAGIKSIQFTGGEATLRREDLLDIVDYASRYLELKGLSAEERMTYEYGTPNPSVDDVIKSDRLVALRKKLMKQLSMPGSAVRPGMFDICDKNTPKDVESIIRNEAECLLEDQSRPSMMHPDSISILSNACFDDQRDFVRKLKSYGNVSFQTSLDSYDPKTLDENRGRPGVYDKVKSLVDICLEEGVQISISATGLGGKSGSVRQKNYRYFNSKTHLLESHGFLQFGNAVQMVPDKPKPVTEYNHFGALSSKNKQNDGWCKGFTRPDTITIRPTGNVGNCVYAYAFPEEFGSLNNSSMANIINGMQNSELYKMFKDGRIESYQHELDTSLFPQTFKSSCEPIVLTAAYGLVKERLIREGAPNPVKQANEEVARMYKYI